MESRFVRGRPAVLDALVAVCNQIDKDIENELEERDQRHALLVAELERLKPSLENVTRLEQENRALQAELLELRKELQAQSSLLDGEDNKSAPKPNAALQSPARHPLGEIDPNVGKRARVSESNAADKCDNNFSTICHDTNHDQLETKYIALKGMYKEAKSAAVDYRKKRDRWQIYAEHLERKHYRPGKKNKKGSKCQEQPLLAVATSSLSPIESSTTEQDLARGAKIVELLKAATASSTPSNPPPIGASQSPSTLKSHSETPLHPRLVISTTACPSPSKAISDPEKSLDTVLVGHSSIPLQDGTTSSPATSADGTSSKLPRLPPESRAIPKISVKQEPTSDEPTIFEERSVRKRKRNELSKEENSSSRLKSEEGSSDPELVGESCHFSPHESIDLDIDQDAMNTPRKRRISDTGNLPERNDHEARDTECPVTDGRKLNSITSESRNATGPRPFSEAYFTHIGSSRPSALQQPALGPVVLKPFRLLRPTDTHSLKLARGIAELADDGGSPFSLPPTNTPTGPGRLHTLLNHPSPERDAILVKPNRHIRENPHSLKLVDVDVPSRELPFGKDNTKIKFRTPKTSLPESDRLATNPSSVARLRLPIEHGAPQVRTGTLLRDRPVSSLNLDDFKINPKVNAGHDFAYSEVVRGRSERAELPGCTDPQCCGPHFRSMAMGELLAADSGFVNRAENMTLLEAYLGEQANQLGSLSESERQGLWVEARAQRLADKHGRHRHRHSRRQSPPGFWNVDFPSTQEMARDREEGEKRERQMVEERRREAMRPGGRWLFRDE